MRSKTTIIIVLALLIITGTIYYSVKDKRIAPRRILTGVPSEKIWTFPGEKAKTPLGATWVKSMCRKGVTYLFFSGAFRASLAPEYTTDGDLKSCTEDVWPASDYSFYEVCKDNILYYQFTGDRAQAVSPALEPNGKPLNCTINSK